MMTTPNPLPEIFPVQKKVAPFLGLLEDGQSTPDRPDSASSAFCSISATWISSTLAW